MKKLLVSLMAMSVISLGSGAFAANAVSTWMTNTANKINKAESSVNSAKSDAAAAKKAQKEAAKQRKAQAKAQKEAAKKAVNEEVGFWKSLFTFDK